MKEKSIFIVNSIDRERLINFLYEIDKDFIPCLSDNISIPIYAKKLIENAKFFVAILDSTIIGLIAFYCNDSKKKNAYISIIGLSQQHRSIGIGSRLLLSTIDHIRQEGFETVTLETWESNSAQLFYQKHGFEIFQKVAEQGNELVSLKMKLWIGNIDKSSKGFKDIMPVKFN